MTRLVATRLRASELLALAYVMTIPFDGLAAGSRSVPFLVGLIYVGAAALRHALDPPPIQISPSAFAAPFALLMTSGLSYFWSLDQQATLIRILSLAFLLVTTWFLAHDAASLGSKIPLMYMVGALVTAILALLAAPTPDGRRTANGDPNDVAISMVLGIGCALYLLLAEQRTESRSARALASIALPVLGLATIATGSRTGILAGTAIAMAAALVKGRSRPGKRRVIVTFMVLATLGTAMILPDSYRPSRLLGHSQGLNTSPDVFNGRERIWTIILSGDFGTFGVGAGAGRSYLLREAHLNNVAHNAWLEVWLELGIAGVLLLMAIVVTTWRLGRKSPHAALLRLLVPALLVGSMALSLEARRLSWFVIALALTPCLSPRPLAGTKVAVGQPQSLKSRGKRSSDSVVGEPL